jgi:putative oxidoreductase
MSMSSTRGEDVAGSRGMGRALNIALWILQIGIAVMFLVASFPKLAGAEQAVAAFDQIGIGQWFRYVTGGLEALGAIALLIPRFVGLGALVLACVMVGAVATHLFVIGGSPVPALVFLVLTSIIAWARRDRTARLLAG